MQYMLKVCVVGLGYIGLPTASILATKGFKVVGIDTNKNAVRTINSGQAQIYEPDLDILVKAAVQSGNLVAKDGAEKADVFIISVPTPFKEEKTPDLKYVQSAVMSIAPHIENGNIIILESTSPIGTTERISKWLQEKRPDLRMPVRNYYSDHEIAEQVYIAHCPERVLPGHILKELVGNDRIIGGLDKISAQKTKEFYQHFVKGNIYTTDARTAEMSKLVENSYRDVNIAFANELSIICDRLEINVWELIELANHHPRVNILQPGAGVGGHCIAVDPWFIVDATPDMARLIKTAREVNDNKPLYIVDKIKQKAVKIKDPIIACLGLSYKADIDDLRESPALKIVKQIAEANIGEILVVEPHIECLPHELEGYANVSLVDLNSALDKADLVTLLTDHSAFKSLNRELLNEKILIDTRGVWR